MCLFRDPQELTAIVFPELHVKVLALNLELLGLDNVVHLLKAAILRRAFEGMKEDSARPNPRLILLSLSFALKVTAVAVVGLPASARRPGRNQFAA
jgi:hypothetical protein